MNIRSIAARNSSFWGIGARRTLLTLAAVSVLAALSAAGSAVQPVFAQSETEAVSGLVLANDGAGTLSISWDVPARTPTDYRVNWAKSTANFPSYRLNYGNAYPTDNSHKVTGLEEGVDYKVRVRARYRGNQLTEGQRAWKTPWSEVSSITTNNAATGVPTISGTAEVGQTLTADTSGIRDDDGLAGVSFSYQWLADDADISGVTASTYLLTTSEMGKAIKVRVSFTDEGGNDEVLTSAATGAVSPAIQQQQSTNTPATGAPTISGTAQVGETLTADTSEISDDDGLDDVSYSYQWIRSDGTTDTDISAATSSTYTLVDADQGETIKVKVSFDDDEGNAEILTSAPTTAVKQPLTASVTSRPASHTGTGTFTFEFSFSEEPKAGFSRKTLRNHAFTVTGGSVDVAGRTNRPSNIPWRITIEPDGDGGRDRPPARHYGL